MTYLEMQDAKLTYSRTAFVTLIQGAPDLSIVKVHRTHYRPYGSIPLLLFCDFCDKTVYMIRRPSQQKIFNNNDILLNYSIIHYIYDYYVCVCIYTI